MEMPVIPLLDRRGAALRATVLGPSGSLVAVHGRKAQAGPAEGRTSKRLLVALSDAMTPRPETTRDSAGKPRKAALHSLYRLGR